ncbi:hypothetical protein [Desulfoluna butyratoxydans]|uniref:Uncharacterized protein n=1 Tax=Desulfoluna butyratoxydans TaxID=231438 RepID=A0A4V6ILJ6_9BACT|nr:hypothetical protein [Desulfoluna butyratoxydans]VFQ45358.1 hypothetical protein MSL71_30150 [Desulfoluna butyratoxydans]
MAQQNRNTLKKYFKKGALPTEKQFADLIDSVINIIDDGFEKSAEHGLKIAAIGEREKLISFFRKMEMVCPDWSMGIHPDTGCFHLRNGENKSLLTLTPEGKVGIGCEDPRSDLDLHGTIAMEGRTGRFGNGVIPADGRWHTLVNGLDGCQAFEVMAGAGKKREGRYALVHAVALNTFRGRGKVVMHQAYFDARRNRILLRWRGKRHDYRLEMRTCRAYGGDAAVRYGLTRLWDDPFMDTCVLPSDEGQV